MLKSKINLNKRLAIIAFLLGVAALIAGTPGSDGKVYVDTKKLALEINNKSAHISVEKLAEWIIAEKNDFRLIDLRSESEFNEYHIAVAENIKVPDFNEIEMPRNNKYILISDSDIITSQTWFLLKARGYMFVYMIDKGMEEWNNNILFPLLSANATDKEKSDFEKIKEISKFFGGQPKIAGDSIVVENVKISMPKPAKPAQVNLGPKKKLRKEGC